MKKKDKRNKKKKKKGFTLIELLAVIVILGLLMAIAIPSITKYLTESRKKTLVTTIGNYINALVNEVNDLNYTFTENNTIYAVPIECIALERGGTNPFGNWYQANNAYWAYVLVQYDDQNSKYIYGFIFKDSAGYGLYPTIQSKLKENGSQIKTGLKLKRPETGIITDVTSLDNWKTSGFEVDENTELVVLEAGSEGEIGDGKETCTLMQKGNNYEDVEKNKVRLLSELISKHNPDIKTNPTITTTSEEAEETGLYVSTDTNSGDPTYYFRGNVTNNYVKFANQTWRIIRINEDGTIRLVLQDGINNNSKFEFNSKGNDYSYMYYSNSDTAKPAVDTWYETNIKGYDSYVAIETFCEQAKVKYYTNTLSGNAKMVNYKAYKPNFKCEKDGNEKEPINSKVGLITYDEIVHAGGFYGKSSSYYLYNGSCGTWTMSPSGISSGYTIVWSSQNTLYSSTVDYPGNCLRPIINLESDVMASGIGTSNNPYIIQTN